MAGTINMQDMRYLNLFGKITRVDTRFCFKYNEAIVFCVPKQLVSKSVGQAGKNVKKLNEILHKKIKIIPAPNSINDAEQFLRDIVSPVGFKGMEVTDDEIILTAGSQNKAALIGRNKRRMKEMQQIVADYFKRDFRIV
ncbi:hypothetical protein ACFLZJ_01650 [Nanoarchaeota archaeon]